MPFHSNRRQFLALSAAAGIGALAPRSSRAADGQIVAATWGGDTERVLRETAAQMMTERHSVEVLFDTGTPSARKTKLLAEASRPVNSLDIVHLTDKDMYQMQKQGLLADIDESKVSNYQYVFENFRTGYSVPTFYSALVLVYNKNHISGMTSWKDLWKDEYAGKIGFVDLSYDKIVPIASWTFGQTTNDYEPGKQALLELRERGLRLYPSNEAAGNAFASEEIIAAIQWKGRAVQWSEAGLPLAYSVPVEGAHPTVFEMGIARNSGAIDPSHDFLDIVLEPEVQQAAADAIGQTAVTSHADFPPELEARVGFTDAERDNFIPLNHDYAIEQGSALLDWWEKEFKGS